MKKKFFYLTFLCCLLSGLSSGGKNWRKDCNDFACPLSKKKAEQKEAPSSAAEFSSSPFHLLLL